MISLLLLLFSARYSSPSTQYTPGATTTTIVCAFEGPPQPAINWEMSSTARYVALCCLIKLYHFIHQYTNSCHIELSQFIIVGRR